MQEYSAGCLVYGYLLGGCLCSKYPLHVCAIVGDKDSLAQLPFLLCTDGNTLSSLSFSKLRGNQIFLFEQEWKMA